MLTLIAFIFSSLGVITGLFIETFERASFILTIIITPMTYFGGVFFEISKLPSILSWIGYLNPLVPMINLLRFCYLGVHEGNLGLQFLFVLSAAIVIFAATFFFFNRGVGLKQ